MTETDKRSIVRGIHFPSIEGDCELAQQSGSLSDGGRDGGGSVLREDLGGSVPHGIPLHRGRG